MISSGAFAVTSRLQDLRRNLRKWNHTRENAQLSASPGHAVDSATGFVLADGKAAPAVNGIHAFGAIAAHAGHDDSESEVPEGFGHRVHQHVDGWNMERTFGLRIKKKNNSRLGQPFHGHVHSSGSDVDHAR